MNMIGDEIHIGTDEARSGETPHIARYVLAISLLLAIIALSLVWITGAISLLPERQPVSAVENALGG